MRYASFFLSISSLFFNCHLFLFDRLTRIITLSAVLQKSFHYIGLLKAVMRLSVANMKAADVKDVASSVTAIANEKLKAEKEAAAGKKKTGTHNHSSFALLLVFFCHSLIRLVNLDTRKLSMSLFLK